MRARLQSSTACGIAFSGAGEIVVSTTPPAGEIPELPIVASRGIAFAEQSSARTVVATGNYGLRETFGTGWTASNPVPGGATISAGSIEWTGITAATVTYRLTRATGYTAAQARIDGTATAAGVAAQVGGTASIRPDTIPRTTRRRRTPSR